MKKNNSRVVSKGVNVDSQVISMLSREGFIEVFWDELATLQKEDPSVTREAVFNKLNEKYFKAFGCNRYSNYDSFRQRLNK